MSGSNGNGRNVAAGGAHYPAKLTEVAERALVSALALGAPKTEACEVVGIDATTLERWLKWGESESKSAEILEAEGIDPGALGPCCRLYRGATRARARGIVGRLRALRRAYGPQKRTKTTHYRDGRVEILEWEEPGDWRAAAWLLARDLPARFSEKHLVAHLGKIAGAASESELAAILSDPVLRAALEGDDE